MGKIWKIFPYRNYRNMIITRKYGKNTGKIWNNGGIIVNYGEHRDPTTKYVFLLKIEYLLVLNAGNFRE